MNFKDYIYIDNKALYQYCGQIGIEIRKNASFQSTDTSKVGADVKIIGASMNNEIKENYEVFKSDMDILDNFEKEAILKKIFLKLDDEKNISKGRIFKSDAILYVPEEYKMVAAITEFLPLIKSNPGLFDIPDESAQMLGFAERVLNNNIKIPFFFKSNNYNIYGNLDKNLFVNDFSPKDLDKENFTIIAKIRDIMLGDDELEIFNILNTGIKSDIDFSRLIPTKKENSQFVSKISKPAMMVSVLAIYK